MCVGAEGGGDNGEVGGRGRGQTNQITDYFFLIFIDEGNGINNIIVIPLLS